ncbi:hypothetical protein LCGC14_2536230 [marine sediment metagenome]|uniref:LexA repressor DNA-binding domain-containing protein n=1 Tax=marine sediment metagenome TaxID=412755 RepID=A0A0F9AS32_9ZZZZ
MKVLSPRRRAILREIWRGKGRSPSLKELMQAAKLCSHHTIFHHIRVLRRDGYVTFAPGLARTLTLTDKGLLAAQGFELIYVCDENGIKARDNVY